MSRPPLSILGLLVLLAAATAGLNAQTASPTGDTAPVQTGAVSPAAVVSDQPAPPVDGGQPFDPAALRPDQPYPGTGYPWGRVDRPVPSGTPGGDLTVTGFVYDAPSKRPIMGATVSAQMCVPRAYSALTGTDGRYSS